MMEPQSLHRYALRAVLTEYGYAVAGLVLTLGPLIVTTPLAPVTGVLGALAALFAAYGARTFIRHKTFVRISDDSIETGGLLRRRLGWDELSAFRLGYYSTKRDRTGGWMQLKLKTKDRSLRIDSSIEGFDVIVRASALAAHARGLEFDFAARENLRVLGITEVLADEPGVL